MVRVDTMKANDDAIENVLNPRQLRWKRSADTESCSGAARHIGLTWRDANRILWFSRSTPGWIHTGHDREVQRDVLFGQPGVHVLVELPVAVDWINQSESGWCPG